jgi:hypothetical protein
MRKAAIAGNVEKAASMTMEDKCDLLSNNCQKVWEGPIQGGARRGKEGQGGARSGEW